MTDEELMMAYGRDDFSAFESLYRRHKDKVFGYLLMRLRDRQEAEEVFQQVFMKLHRARAGYSGSVPFLAWLFTIARNALIDHGRKQATHDKYHHYLDPCEEIAIAPDQPDADTEAKALLATLPEGQRQVLTLRFDEGLSFAEIGRQLQTSDANSRQLVSRAIRKLRRLLSDKE